jgi:hypothetical protein
MARPQIRPISTPARTHRTKPDDDVGLEVIPVVGANESPRAARQLTHNINPATLRMKSMRDMDMILEA